MVIAASAPSLPQPAAPAAGPGRHGDSDTTPFHTGRLEAVVEADAESRVEAFRAHWQALPRHNGSLLPHLRTFLDRPAPRLQPFVALIDLRAADHLYIRLFGTVRAETFGRDLTGENVLALCPAEHRKAIAASAQMVAEHPCGQLTRRVVMPVKGVSLRVLSIVLPLATDPGAPRCLANFTSPMDHLPPLYRHLGLGSAGQPAWVDIGAGVPAQAPFG